MQTAISGGGGAQALLSRKPKALSVVSGTFLHSASNLDLWLRVPGSVFGPRTQE